MQNMTRELARTINPAQPPLLQRTFLDLCPSGDLAHYHQRRDRSSERLEVKRDHRRSQSLKACLRRSIFNSFLAERTNSKNMAQLNALHQKTPLSSSRPLVATWC